MLDSNYATVSMPLGMSMCFRQEIEKSNNMLDMAKWSVGRMGNLKYTRTCFPLVLYYNMCIFFSIIPSKHKMRFKDIIII